MGFLKNWLAEPLTLGFDLDDPALTHLRKTVLNKKPFLRAIYIEWYQMLVDCIPKGPGAVLELGSGGGFLKELLPQVVASDIFWLPGNSAVLDGCALPFPNNSLKAIIMTDVLHHIPATRSLFSEACRCLSPGGVIAMIEPWFTPWSGFVYRNFHHELFLPNQVNWEFKSTGPLSAANGALPWIIFERDREIFTREFPSLKIEILRSLMPFSYLLSGGISFRTFMPGWSYRLWRWIERVLEAKSHHLAMFEFIVLRRVILE